jgi:hypothetical protein
MRYFAAAEARNNFIAAGQNVQSCRVYLGRVKFPYATEEEMTLMEQAIQNAFTDIQSNASLKKALGVYQVEIFNFEKINVVCLEYAQENSRPDSMVCILCLNIIF